VSCLAGFPLPDLTPYLPAIIFGALAAISILAALVAATAPRIVHAAFGLMGAFFGVAGLYAMLGADFVALSQVIVYVGGILVLLVFGILLTGRTSTMLGLEKAPRPTFAFLAGGAVFLGLMLAIDATTWNAVENPPEPQPTTAAIGRAFLDPDQYLIPFEVASVLLLAALVGAAYLARRRRGEA
jgi:NADH:ubiquinone oxidoreductase subunit 6 (subunit J)